MGNWTNSACKWRIYLKNIGSSKYKHFAYWVSNVTRLQKLARLIAIIKHKDERTKRSE